MRLIDADELKKVNEENVIKYNDYYTSDMIVGMNLVCEYATKDAPAVDAIPVDWLKEHYPTTQVYGTEQYFRTAYAVQDILAEWERTREEG